MRLRLRSLNPVRHRSTIDCAAESIRGVTFTIRRVSLGRRLELAEAIRGMAQELEFHHAGESIQSQVDAAVLAARIDQVYLRWGLVKIEGLTIDGDEPTADVLFERGPENLLREIAGRIKSECALSDDERKN